MAGENDQVDESIEELRARLAQAEADKTALTERASRAEGERDTARTEAAAASGRVQNSELDVVTSAIGSTRTERDILKARYRAAREAGDVDVEADINIEIADNAAKLRQLEAGKSILEARRDNPPASTRDARPFESLSNNEKVERIAGGLTPMSAAWVRKHPHLVQTVQQVNALTGAHHLAINKNLVGDTDAYFKDIETTLGVAAAGGAQTTAANGSGAGAHTSSAAAPSREVPPAAAPAGAGGSGRAGTIRLSAEQQEAAAASGLTNQEYADQFEKIEAEKRKTTH